MSGESEIEGTAAETANESADDNLKYYNSIISSIERYNKYMKAAVSAAQEESAQSTAELQGYFGFIPNLDKFVVENQYIQESGSPSFSATGQDQLKTSISNIQSALDIYEQQTGATGAEVYTYLSQHAEELEAKLKDNTSDWGSTITSKVKQIVSSTKDIARKITKYYENVQEVEEKQKSEDQAEEAAAAESWDASAAQATAGSEAANIAAELAAAPQQTPEQKAEAEALAAEVAGTITKEQVLYQEQCFLMANLHQLIQYKVDTLDPTNKVLPYQPNVDSGTNASLLLEANPFAFINKLTQYPNNKEFFAMTPGQLSNLVPMIRLYKVVPGSDGSETDVEFSFHSNTTFSEIQNYTKDKDKRGYGVGIKEFSFAYDGNNPFSAKKSIRAKLSLFANGLDELFMCRGGDDTKCDSTKKEDYSTAYRYVDLALKTGKGTSAKKSTVVGEPQEGCNTSVDPEVNIAKLNFRLKAVVGWAMPHNFPNELDDPALLSALNNSFVTLNLTPTIHDFNIDEIGRVNFTIDYLAYVEEFFDSPRFNIFCIPEITTKQTMRRLIFDSLGSSSDCKASEINELKKMDADKIAAEKKESLQALTKHLLIPNEHNISKMKYINLKREELVKFQSEGLYYQLPEGGVTSLITDAVSNPEAQQAGQDAIMSPDPPAEKSDDATEAEKSEAFEKLMMEPGSEQIPFFYVSDLIDIILKGLGECLGKLPTTLVTELSTVKENYPAAALADMDQLKALVQAEQKIITKFAARYKKLRVVLGPLEVKDFKGGIGQYDVSLGDLPVSYKYFLEWMTSKMLAKDDVTYFLAQFLNDFFNLLIKQFMNNDTCFKVNANQKIRLSEATFTSYKLKSASGSDEITAAIIKTGAKRLNMNLVGTTIPMPLLNISGPSGLPITHKSVDYETNYLTFFAGRVMPTEEMQGVREDDEGRGIFHYTMGRQDGLVKNISLSKTSAKYLKEVRFEQDGYDGLKQLREVYDVTVDAFPIVNAFPGTYIYIEPRGWSPSSNSQDLTELGIGGYHMIWKSEHFFAPGRAETKIYAKWVASIGTCATTRKIEDPADTGGGTTAGDIPTKCGATLSALKVTQAAAAAIDAHLDTVGAAPAE